MATTFSILPDQVTETWEWLTDVLSSWNGTEQRIQLRQFPRVTQRMRFRAMDEVERAEQLRLLAEDLDSPDNVPLFAWSAPVAAPASSGTGTVTIDTTALSLNVGDRIVLMNPATREAYGYQLTAVTDTDCDLATNLDVDIDEDWYGMKAMLGLMENRSNLRWGVLTGAHDIDVRSWISPYVQRTGTGASLTNFNSLPLLERTVEDGITDRPEFVRTITDFNIGRRNIGTRHTVMDINGQRSFIVDRADSDDIDYWRLFLDTVKGAQKAFLLSTQLEDMTLASGLSQAGTSMTINEQDQSTLFHPYDSFKNFEIVYSDGTSSNHTISTSVAGVITFTPALPNDPKVANVDRISYLLKVRMTDRITWEHGPVSSRLKFGISTTDDG